jgi:hypothetical protein
MELLTISKQKKVSSEGKQLYQYQKESLNSDGQQFHQYHQNKRKFKE